MAEKTFAERMAEINADLEELDRQIAEIEPVALDIIEWGKRANSAPKSSRTPIKPYLPPNMRKPPPAPKPKSKAKAPRLKNQPNE
jgi:hypothetical protein